MENQGDVFARSRKYCTTREAADRLGIALRTAQLWVDNGILEAWKTEGGHRRISLESVERFMSQDKKGPTPRGMAGSTVVTADLPLRVLIVEDDNVLLKLYRMRIDSWGLPVDVTTASNGYDALILIGRDQPDMMIADLRMPGIDGFQMMRTLHASSFRDGMEIVIVSGMSKEDVEKAGGLPRGVQLLPKPVPFDELRKIVESILIRRRQLASA